MIRRINVLRAWIAQRIEITSSLLDRSDVCSVSASAKQQEVIAHVEDLMSGLMQDHNYSHVEVPGDLSQEEHNVVGASSIQSYSNC